jgi:hypothetical protein
MLPWLQTLRSLETATRRGSADLPDRDWLVPYGGIVKDVARIKVRHANRAVPLSSALFEQK